MTNKVTFVFMNEISNCEVYIDMSADPCYIFVILLDRQLIDMFGEDITIKTDFEQLLERNGDHDKLIALKQAVFDSIPHLPEFMSAKQRLFKYENRKYKV